jgi:rubrerythrin
MAKAATVSTLLEVAIALEQDAEMLYLGLAARFRHHPEIAGFWRTYADEENGHARWLRQLGDRLTPERRANPVDAQMLTAGQKVLQSTIEEKLRDIRHLEDAYGLADELEHSEMNTIFEFLINEFSDSQETHAFLRSQLRLHIEKLMTGFPAQYRGRARRRATAALT